MGKPLISPASSSGPVRPSRPETGLPTGAREKGSQCPEKSREIGSGGERVLATGDPETRRGDEHQQQCKRACTQGNPKTTKLASLPSASRAQSDQFRDCEAIRADGRCD
ncbi:hypothetical protein VTH82DRAFT_8055 [Thermothelomyces myriococcoides]